MSSPGYHLRAIRHLLLRTTDGLSPDQLTIIPDGYRNSILWNACHMLTTQQVLVYGLSGQQPLIEEGFIERYRKGTSPSADGNPVADWDYMREHFMETVDRMDRDLEAGIFTRFTEYATSFGLTLKSAADAAAFNNLHESMHLGYVLAMKHLV